MSSALKRKRFRKSGRPVPKASFPIRKRDLLQKIRKQQQKKRNLLDQNGGSGLLTSVSSQPLCNQPSPLRDCSDVGLTFSSPAELFRSLIDPITTEVFFADYWEKKPLLLKRGASSSPTTLFSLSDLLQIVEKHTVLFGTHVNVCRYVNRWRQSLNRGGRLTPARLRKLWEEEKATFQFHQPQQFKLRENISLCLTRTRQLFTWSTNLPSSTTKVLRKLTASRYDVGNQNGGSSLLTSVSSQPLCNQPSPSRDCSDIGLTFSSPAELFRSLIDPIATEVFFADYWEKKPLLLKRGASSSPTALFSLSDLLQIVEKHTILFGTHVNVCRYVNHWRQSLNRGGRLTPARLRKLWEEEKATFQFHQPQQFKDILWRVLSHLESYFSCLVGSNVYLTPAGSQGLAPHYDDVEVFILQLEGCKHWRLYRPPVELPQTCSHDLSQEEIGEPTHDFVLEAGDLLYFPRGTVHQADTPTHTPHSTHITISTYQNHSWSTLLGHLLDHTLQRATSTDPDFRRGLPLNLLNIPGGAAPREGNHPMEDSSTSEKVGGNLWGGRVESLKEKAKSLVVQLSKCPLDVPAALESVSRDFIASRLPPYTGSEELGPQGPLPDLQAFIQPTWPDYTYLSTLSSEPDDNGEGVEPGISGHTHQQWVVMLHSLCNQRGSHMTGAGSQEPTGVRLPLHYKEALEMLFVPPPAKAIPVYSLPLAADDDKNNLAVTLWAEGLIRVTPK